MRKSPKHALKILGISGSMRRDSSNTALLKELAKIIPAGVQFHVLETLQNLPIFSPDHEGSKTPASVLAFAGMVRDADALVFSSPEYVHGIPGGLKNAIDWLVSREELIQKPIALMHASHRGDFLLESLREVLRTVSQNFDEQNFLRFGLMKKSPAEISAFFNEPERQNELRTFMQKLCTYAHHHSEPGAMSIEMDSDAQTNLCSK